MSNNLSENETINGPVNIIRLEGYIGKIKKIVYLFFDTHSNNTECENIFSDDIHKYLLKTFNKALDKRKDITYDFFVEIYDKSYKYTMNGGRKNYLIFIWKLFLNLKHNKKIKNKYVNVRAHFVDLRGLISESLNQTNDFFYRYILDPVNIIWKEQEINESNINRLLFELNDYKNTIIFLKYIIDSKKTTTNKIKFKFIGENKKIKEESLKILQNIFSKLNTKYDNSDVKKKIKICINKFI